MLITTIYSSVQYDISFTITKNMHDRDDPDMEVLEVLGETITDSYRIEDFKDLNIQETDEYLKEKRYSDLVDNDREILEVVINVMNYAGF